MVRRRWSRMAGMAALLTVLGVGLAGPAAAQGTGPDGSSATTGASGAENESEGQGVAGLLCNRGDAEASVSTQVVGSDGRQQCNVDGGITPVAGVLITVTDASGAKVGEGRSDDSGSYRIEVPAPDRYTATLDAGSLPDGVVLTEADSTTRVVTVNEGQFKQLLFPFGNDTREQESWTVRFISLFISGIRLGLIIAMTAIGLSLIYGTTKFTNFAHGEMVTFGALAAFLFNQGFGWPLLAAIPAAILVGAGLGGVMEAGLWRPLRRRKINLFGLMIVSFGLSTLLLNVFQYIFGTRNRPYNEYYIQKGINVGGALVPPKEFVIIIVSVVVLGLVGLFLQKTKFGKAVRAVADNPALASSSGINTDQVVLIVWVLGGGLAALGGILYSVSDAVLFNQGQTLLLLMFAGVTLGGLGTAYGAAAGCFVLGLAIQLSTIFVPTSLKNVGALVALILVLMWKPEGLFGQRERIG